jgi:hypothetical protein
MSQLLILKLGSLELTAVLKKMVKQIEIRKEPSIFVWAAVAYSIRGATNCNDSCVWLDIRRAEGSKLVVIEPAKCTFSSSKASEVCGFESP